MGVRIGSIALGGSSSGSGASDAWPIGSVFISVVATDPSVLLGFGTWVAFGSGRVMVGLDAADPDFDTAEEVGGEKTHLLVTAEIPSHTHAVTDPGHVHGITDPTHNHVQDAHLHGITDPTHNHVQNAHLHAITDPTHAHTQQVRNTGTAGTAGSQGSNTANLTAVGVTVAAATSITINNATATNQVAATGITVNNATATNQAAATSITINSGVTGITNVAAGGGGTHNNVQPYIVCFFLETHGLGLRRHRNGNGYGTGRRLSWQHVKDREWRPGCDLISIHIEIHG
jgi:microcystin-dependent protein